MTPPAKSGSDLRRHRGTVAAVLCSLVAWFGSPMRLPAAGPDHGQDVQTAKPLWLAIGPAPLLTGLTELAEHRRADGFEVALSSAPIADAIKAAPRRPAFIVLVGDDAPKAQGEPWYLPASRRTMVQWKKTTPVEYATDAPAADLDGDGFPDVPLGRLPVRSAAEAATLAKKIVAFEKLPPSLAQLGVPIWAGNARFGATVETLVPLVLRQTVGGELPRVFEPWIMLSQPGDPAFAVPAQHARLFNERLLAGSAISAFVGHGQRQWWESMRFEDKVVRYTTADVAALAKGPPAAPMILLACFCGSFAEAEPSMAETLLAAPAGPVAVIGAAQESHPVPNLYSARAMARFLDGSENRLGALWLKTLRSVREENLTPILVLAQGIIPRSESKTELGQIPKDHPQLYALLGDPATKLALPQPLEATLTPTAGGWEWKVTPPPGATELHLGVRDFERPQPAREATPLEQHQQVNAAYRYREVTVKKGGEPWAGKITEAGEWRFVAFTKTGLHAVVLRAKK